MKTLINYLLSYIGYIFIKKPNSYKSLSNVFLKCNVIIDVGVADGTFDLWKLLDSNSEIYLIDPFIDHYTYKIKYFNYCNKVVFLKNALSDYNGITKMKNIGRSSSFSKFDSINVNSEDIEVKKLSDLITLSDNKSGFPNLLKIDVEGFELEVIKGIGEIYKYIDFVIIEIGFFSHDGNIFYELISILHQFDFQVIEALDAPKNPNGSNGTLDLLFVNKKSKYKEIYLNSRFIN